MFDGIPIVYYGLEQAFTGGPDPGNREALWPSGYANTTAVQVISKLNKIRNWMIKLDAQRDSHRKRMEKGGKRYGRIQGKPQQEKLFAADWRDRFGVTRRDRAPQTLGFIDSASEIVGVNEKVMGIVRGSVIGVVTNIGSPVSLLLFSLIVITYLNANDLAPLLFSPRTLAFPY